MLQKQLVHSALGHEGSHLQQLFQVQRLFGLGVCLRGFGFARFGDAFLRAVVLGGGLVLPGRLEDAVDDVIKEGPDILDRLLQGGAGLLAVLRQLAREQLLHGDAEEVGEVHQGLYVGQRRAVFPLGNGLMRNIQRGSKLLLGHVSILPEGCDGPANCAIVNHAFRLQSIYC